MRAAFVALISTSLFLMSCSTPEPPALQPGVSQPLARIYFTSFDKVWKAIHLALIHPIGFENADTGYLETDVIKGANGWVAPHRETQFSSGLRYKITFTLTKGRANGRESTRVTIQKKMELLRDFFSEPEAIRSDGFEEKALFYRIEREIIINDAINGAPRGPASVAD